MSDASVPVTRGQFLWRNLDGSIGGGEASPEPVVSVAERIEQLEWAIVRTLYAGDIEPPNPAAPFWFREQLLRDSGLTMERCRELMDLHRGEDRVARL